MCDSLAYELPNVGFSVIYEETAIPHGKKYARNLYFDILIYPSDIYDKAASCPGYDCEI